MLAAVSLHACKFLREELSTKFIKREYRNTFFPQIHAAEKPLQMVLTAYELINFPYFSLKMFQWVSLHENIFGLNQKGERRINFRS